MFSSGRVSNYLIEEASKKYKLSMVDSIRISKFVMLYFMEEYRLRKLLGEGVQELLINGLVELRYEDPWSAFVLDGRQHIGSLYVEELPGYIRERLDEMVLEVFSYLQLVKSEFGLKVLLDFYELYLKFGTFRNGRKFIKQKLLLDYEVSLVDKVVDAVVGVGIVKASFGVE